MSTLNISLPEDLRAAVEEQVSSGRYATHSEYVRSLIRQDQEKISRDRLEALLLARLESGDSVEMNDADWKQIRQEFLRRVNSHRKAGTAHSKKASRGRR